MPFVVEHPRQPTEDSRGERPILSGRATERQPVDDLTSRFAGPVGGHSTQNVRDLAETVTINPHRGRPLVFRRGEARSRRDVGSADVRGLGTWATNPMPLADAAGADAGAVADTLPRNGVQGRFTGHLVAVLEPAASSGISGVALVQRLRQAEEDGR